MSALSALLLDYQEKSAKFDAQPDNTPEAEAALQALDAAMMALCAFRPASPEDGAIWKRFMLSAACRWMDGSTQEAESIVAVLCDGIAPRPKPATDFLANNPLSIPTDKMADAQAMASVCSTALEHIEGLSELPSGVPELVARVRRTVDVLGGLVDEAYSRLMDVEWDLETKVRAKP